LGKHIEVSGLKKNGEEFPVELSVSPIQDGELVLFVGCLRDISERHALRLAGVELARVMQMMAMGEMAASIAHEINQPLGAIVANGNATLRWLSRATPDFDRARSALQRVVNDSVRASEVISGIRLMFKNDSHEKAPQDVNGLVREVLKLMRVELENHHVSVHTELLDELPEVPANRVQLRQVIVNLVMNAIDAMNTVVNRARILRVRTEIYDLNYLLITIEDSGTGIDLKNFDRIFEAFFTTKSRGMGLGLSICRSIIESHGGRLSASPGQHYGSIFHVLLPSGAIVRNDE
jgi:signal transduction histidine kinase